MRLILWEDRKRDGQKHRHEGKRKREKVQSMYITIIENVNWLYCALWYIHIASTEALPGAVDSSYLVKRNLDNSAMQRYPLVLIKLMTRLAEDLIWANNLDKAKAVFQFVVTITKERTDALEYRKSKQKSIVINTRNKQLWALFGSSYFN